MNSLIWTSATVIAFLAIIGTHEAGHALAMRLYGIPIDKAGLGMPYAPRIVLHPTRRRPFRLSLSPWILGAYVTPAETHTDRLNDLPYLDRAWIAGAGIVTNAITGCALGAVLAAINHNWQLASILAAVGAAVAARPRHFCAYIAPALTIPAAGLIVWTLLDTLGQPEGPVGTGRAMYTTSLLGTASITAAFALGLAILNLLPVFPFDGGRIVTSLAAEWGGDKARIALERTGATFAITLIGYCLATDAWWLIRG